MFGSRKRSYDELDAIHHSLDRRTKQKITDLAATETKSNSSYASRTAPVFSDSDIISHETDQTEIESDSELSTSSEEPSSSSSGEDESEVRTDTSDGAMADEVEEVINVRPGTKPEMKIEGSGESLLQRLQTLLPELKAANQELEEEKAAGTLEHRNIEMVEDGAGQHIEMNLGLGVLKENCSDTDSNEQEEDDCNSDTHDNDTDFNKKEVDVLGKLMGRSKGTRKPVQIEEVGDD